MICHVPMEAYFNFEKPFHTHMCVHTHTHMYIYRERQRRGQRDRERGIVGMGKWVGRMSVTILTCVRLPPRGVSCLEGLKVSMIYLLLSHRFYRTYSCTNTNSSKLFSNKRQRPSSPCEVLCRILWLLRLRR